MSPNVPASPLFSTLPVVSVVELLMTPDELRDRLALLEAGGELGAVERERWRRAAVDGKWTAEELLTAVQWLNVNHEGYVKIAHVHKQIESERSWLRTARLCCQYHELAVTVVSEVRGAKMTPEQVLHFNQDYRRDWLAPGGFADRIMAFQSTKSWVAWIQKVIKTLPADL